MFLSLCLCFMNPVTIPIVEVGDDLCFEWDYFVCQDVAEEDRGHLRLVGNACTFVVMNIKAGRDL